MFSSKIPQLEAFPSILLGTATRYSRRRDLRQQHKDLKEPPKSVLKELRELM